MRLVHSKPSVVRKSSTDRRVLVDGLTLICLGLSVLLLNSWNTLFVRACIGLFWGSFFLIINWSSLVLAVRVLTQKNVTRRRTIE
jgi:tetrahydromethanopterin S-methyltransferase subunit E